MPTRPAVPAALVLFLAGSSLAAQLPPEPRPESRPESRPATRPEQPRQPPLQKGEQEKEAPPAPAAIATGDAEALALARRVVGFAGGEAAMRRVGNIVFTFHAGETRRRLLWDRTRDHVRVESISMPRTRGPVPFQVRVHDLGNDRELVVHPAPPPQAPKQGGARAIFVNDGYWLLVAHKVLDPGVLLGIDPAEEGDPEQVRRLRLRFDRVGITPKNEYVLHVEVDTGRIVRWDHYRTAKSRPTSWTFEDYRRVGPLLLSLSRRQIVPQGSRRPPRDIRFDDVAVDVPLPEGVWTTTAKVLVPSAGKPEEKEEEPGRQQGQAPAGGEREKE